MMFVSLKINVAYEHAKRRGITALATACDRSDPGRKDAQGFFKLFIVTF